MIISMLGHPAENAWNSLITYHGGAMRSRVLLLAVLGLVIGFVLPAAAQITITAADVSATFAPGKTSYTYQDTTATTLNLGGLGSTLWDFRSLRIDLGSTLTSVTPASTPYAADFPGATNAFQTTQSTLGIAMTVYQYFTLGTNLLNPGNMGGASSQFGPLVYSLKNTPAAVTYPLPSTYGTTWSSSYSETFLITVGGSPFVGPTVTNYTESYVADAYGPMTMPGGATYQALRIRYQERSPELRVGYIFIAKEGAIVTVVALDTLSASTGAIPVASISWISPTAVGVSTDQTAPAEYALLQNFPNPFNPTSEITYQLPVAGSVKLSVYDLLGREVAVLVNETKAPGQYTARFDAKGLSSGVYVYRLEAGNFVQARRMLLVR
jgi:hypothetical protein